MPIPFAVNPLRCAEKDLPRGPNGRKLCRCGCGREAIPPRRVFFSEECVQAYLNAINWGSMVYAIRERDQGICAICGVDTIALRQEVADLYHIFGGRYSQKGRGLDKCLTTEGWPTKAWRVWYDIDHIIQRQHGGTNHPDNLRLLCVPCHKERHRVERDLINA